MGFVALLTIGMSIPASAFGTAQTAQGYADATTRASAAQALSVPGVAAGESIDRDGYGTTSRAVIDAAKAAEAAKKAGASAAATHRGGFNSGTGPVRWPFPSSVPLGPGFGAPSTCRGCQPVHMGQDFLAKNGAEIYAIADGVVTKHDSSGSFGNHVIITHTVDGHTITSLYAHMQPSSSPLNVGDTVAVGQYVGLVGTTGAVTAPHLHFEITSDGTKVDPYAWLEAHAS